ncbi:hypothetical protein QLX08_011422 [Tetragonisca angustula]|uniref:Protein grindelwald n=1 Tax=Tetragonisca angustula TaxID=166442 RepID=A0AAW0Z8D7_9HYME
MNANRQAVVVNRLLVVVTMAIGAAVAGLSPLGADCGERRCSTVEYCSPYDKRCKPCSSICDANGRNYQQDECFKDCQEYLHDKRYVLLEQYEDLRGEVERLWILVAICVAVAFSSLLASLYLLAQRFTRWEKMRTTLSRAFTGKRRKGTPNANDANENNNDRCKASSLRDAESGTSRQHNGLKLTMSTISASVAPSRYSVNETTTMTDRGNDVASGSASGSGSGSGTGNATPNTTTTTLSRRHPSEDTTLDYAYDNPAMTPSPEVVQHRTKRESSF